VVGTKNYRCLFCRFSHLLFHHFVFPLLLIVVCFSGCRCQTDHGRCVQCSCARASPPRKCTNCRPGEVGRCENTDSSASHKAATESLASTSHSVGAYSSSARSGTGAACAGTDGGGVRLHPDSGASGSGVLVDASAVAMSVSDFGGVGSPFNTVSSAFLSTNEDPVIHETQTASMIQPSRHAQPQLLVDQEHSTTITAEPHHLVGGPDNIGDTVTGDIGITLSGNPGTSDLPVPADLRSSGDTRARQLSSTLPIDNSPTIFQIYDNVVHWRKHLFKVPNGNVGKSFVRELNNQLQAFCGSKGEDTLSLYRFFIMPSLLLQSVAGNSRAKDNTDHLRRRLELWRDACYS